MSTPGRRILATWHRLSSWPGGETIFGWLLRRMVPYSATVYPKVLELEPGYARVSIPDHPTLRNHLKSVHAVALANVGELASGLAMTTALPDDIRGIVVRLRVEYLKKARGPLVAESRCVVPAVTEDAEHDFVAEIRDEQEDVVAKVIATWRLGRLK